MNEVVIICFIAFNPKNKLPAVQLNLQIYNGVGQILLTLTFTETINVSVSNLESGIYYCCSIKNNKIVAVQKIAKVN